jgi:hypothetical protein
MQPPGDEGARRSDADDDAHQAVMVDDRRDRLLDRSELLAQDLHEIGADRGEPRAAAAPLEEGNSELGLERSDLLADGRWRDAAPSGGLRERLRGPDGEQRAEQLVVDRRRRGARGAWCGRALGHDRGLDFRTVASARRRRSSGTDASQIDPCPVRRRPSPARTLHFVVLRRTSSVDALRSGAAMSSSTSPLKSPAAV